MLCNKSQFHFCNFINLFYILHIIRPLLPHSPLVSLLLHLEEYRWNVSFFNLRQDTRHTRGRKVREKPKMRIRPQEKKMRKTKKPKIRTSFNHYLVFLAWTSLGVNSARSSMVIRCAIVKILILYYGVWSQYSRLEFLLFSYLTIQHRNCIFYYSTSFSNSKTFPIPHNILTLSLSSNTF